MKNIIRTLKISKPLHGILYTILALSFVSAVVTQFAPLLSKAMVDQIESEITSGDGDKELLLVLIIASFGALMLQTLLSSLSQRIGDHFGGELRRFLLVKFYDHIFRLPQSYFDTELSGKIVNQLNRGIFSVEQFMKAASNFIFPNVLLSVFTIALMAVYSWQVALFTIILFPIYTTLSMYSAKKWGKEEVAKNKHEDNSRGRIQEVITNMRLVKGFTNQSNELNYVDKEQESINKIYARQSKTFHIFDFLRNTSLNIILLAMSIVIFYGGFEGTYSLGTVVLLIQLINQIRRPLFAMSFILSQIQTTEAGTKEFFEIMDIKAEEKYEEVIKDKIEINSISFKDVAFSYEKGEEVLKDVSLEIKMGEKVALVGHSGAGKSTIINLITKFYNSTNGDLFINDTKYSELSHNQVRSNISLVFQENELFSTTIRENVAYGKVVDDADVIESLKKANVWGFVSKFKDGIDSQIGERGIKLSGGQKQRIQIARAILDNSPVVILDEATSNLDSKSEAEVQEAMETLMKGKMVIIIAHRFSTIQNVDKIFVVDGGKIVDSGAPKELSTREGIYRDLLTYQVEGDKKLLENFEIF
ncbi:MAG: ABC transporter ATP-binding protein [Candidatus Dojkabacteria bacterium]|nr:ABC transporter ATP-binding protein [Candidatus Dojkabacteria bacterium]MDQ7021066.1 ABC transporter ATP-binding protein [Candidatus Dojkabacteria bacterium]